MQVRNNREHSNLQLQAYMNRGELVDYIDPASGKEMTKLAKPVFQLIHIPPLATVELDDEVWESIRLAVMNIKEMKVTKEEIENITKGKEKVYKTVRTPTGRTQKVNIIKQMVEGGRITIVEDTKCLLSLEDKKDVVEATGMLLPKDATDEYIEQMYLIVK